MSSSLKNASSISYSVASTFHNTHKIPLYFFENVNLLSILAYLSRKTWTQDRIFEIVNEGWRQGYGNYYLYVLDMKKPVGVDPWGFPTKKLTIYYSWKLDVGNKFKIISGYPFTQALFGYQQSQIIGLC